MKRSFIIASLIILFGTITSWPAWQKFTGAKGKNAQLVKAVSSLSSDHHQATSRKARKNERDTASTTDGKALAREIINIKRLAKGYKNPQNPSETYSDERLREIYEPIYDLTPSQIKAFFQEYYLIADPSEFSESDITHSTEFFMRIFSEKYTTEMMDLLDKSPEIFKNDTNNIINFKSAIIHWKAHFNKDPATAFQCLAKLNNIEPSLRSDIISNIIDAANTPEIRTETLEAMRAYATTPEQKKLLLNHLSDLALGDGIQLEFAEASAWLKSAAFSTEELSAATMDIAKKVRTGDIPQWIDWLSSSELPEGDSQARAYSLVAEWTNKDYKAVGNWLNNAPDSPQKHAAIGAYAITTYPYDPDNSMKWVQTIPQGPKRSYALERIYRTMPEDSDAAKAFAREHGIKK